MSFAVWGAKPPFDFAPEDREQLYQVGDVWVVTDDPRLATQEEVDRVRALAAAPPRSISDGKLAALLIAKKFLTQEDIDTAIANPNP